MTRSGAPSAIRTHGAGGYARGCRCDTCTTGKREYAREWRRRTYTPQMVDAAPYAAIVRAVWHETRQPVTWIARQAHVNPDTIRHLLDGRAQRVWISTAAGVRSLTVWLPSGGGEA